MSRDWFDPFGIRGTRLDPFVVFTNALKGQGQVGQSAELLSTAIVRRVVGRTVHIDGEPPITATIEAVDEARPPAPIAAVPTGVVEVPMWERVRLRLTDVRVGPWGVDHVAIDVRDIRLVGVGGRAMRVGGTEFAARLGATEVEGWAAAVDGDHRVRVGDRRIEVSDRRLARWAWVEVDVVAHDQSVIVTPRAVRALGRRIGLPAWLRRTVERPAPWLPSTLAVHEVEAAPDSQAVVRGSVGTSVIPVDPGKVLTDLGTESTVSVLRIVAGDW